jgi:hypothetical protein
LILAAKYYCETQDIVVNIDICRLMEIRGGDPSSTDGSSSQSYVLGAEKLMAMELRVLDLIDFNLYVSIQEYNQTQSIFNAKIKAEKQRSERTTVADSEATGSNMDNNLLRNKRVYKSQNDLTTTKEVSKIKEKQTSTPTQ